MAVRGARLRAAQPGRLAHRPGRHRLDHRDPRRRRRACARCTTSAATAARSSSRRAAARQAHRLPVPPVDLRHRRRAHLLPRHARHRQVAVFAEESSLRNRRRLDLHLARRDAAAVRPGARADGAVPAAAGLRARQGGEAGRLRDPRQLEAGVGEQPRVLPLQRQPSAVHQGQLGPLQRGRHLGRGARGDRPRQ